MQCDTEYFRRRACEERYAAEKSCHPLVYSRHLEFAEAYEARLREVCAQDRLSAFHFVATGPFVGLPDMPEEHFRPEAV
jgi:hypothetical protein